MFLIRRFSILAALGLLAPSASAQTGPMLTPSAFIDAPGYLGLDILGTTIGDEPNYLTFAQAGTFQYRTRIDGPILRLRYVPSARAEFTAEMNAQTFAVNDPRYRKTISDFGDATLRAKLGLKKGERSVSPAVALQFQVTLPNTSFGNGLGPNTLRFASSLLVGYKTEKWTLAGRAGLAIEDEPLRQHEQKDFFALSGSITYKLADSLDAFADSGGHLGDGTPGAIAKREVRVGVEKHGMMIGGRATSLYLGLRRGLVDFTGRWGVVAGISTALKAGEKP